MLKNFILVFITVTVFHGCAYRFSQIDRSLPGGYKRVAVPVFTNKTYEPGAEVSFTNALIRELERFHQVAVVDKSDAEVSLVGEVVSLQYSSSGIVTEGVPPGTSLSSTYRVLATIQLRLIENSTQREIWQGPFVGERSYQAPLVTLKGLTSVNPLFNQSARMETIDVLARDMMLEVHNRLTERF